MAIGKYITHTAFGCRGPNSKGTGFWDAAYVYVDTSIGSKAGKFINGCDYVGVLTFKQAQEMYEKLLAEGWTKMTREDITKTSGVELDDNTIIPF